MDLTTTYLGLNLRTPLVASASPLSEKLESVIGMAEAGASAIVLNSLYEEQLIASQQALHHHTTHGTESFPEALSYFPDPPDYHVGPEGYLEHIRKCKEAVDIPIIASLNATNTGSWTEFASKMEEAGADAIELNIYYIPTDPLVTGTVIEDRYLEILKAVKSAVKIPVAVKLSPFFTSLANMAYRLDNEGKADGLVLFNRFYQPDIDLEELEVYPHVLLSTPQALRLPLRWIAILARRMKADLAATSGVHTHEDVLKLLMVGANVTMMASALLRNGAQHFKTVEQGLVYWMEEHEYESVKQMQGSMSYQDADDASAFERTQYMKALTEYHVAGNKKYI